MSEHLIVCRLIGPDLFGDKNWGFEPDLPRREGSPAPLYKWRKCDLDEKHDLEKGYFALWVTCSQKELAALVADGYVEKLLHEGADGDVAPDIVTKIMKEQAIPTEVAKQAPREAKTDIDRRTRIERGLAPLPEKDLDPAPEREIKVR